MMMVALEALVVSRSFCSLASDLRGANNSAKECEFIACVASDKAL
jgi:hypothetical protein